MEGMLLIMAQIMVTAVVAVLVLDFLTIKVTEVSTLTGHNTGG